MYPPHEQKRLDHEQRLRETFNGWAASVRMAEMEYEHRPVTEQVIGRMKLGAQDAVLEVGCGDGWAARRMAGICTEGAVVGVDVSDEMISLARQKSVDFENLMFAVGAVEEIPWTEDYFRRVLSVESAYYWFSPEKAVRELFRVTAFGGGVFLLMSYYNENPHSQHWQEHVDLPLNRMSAAEWAELLNTFGFQQVTTERVVDDTPVPEDFQPDFHWRSREEKLAFQRAGILLVTGKKPDLPPPGPIDPLVEKEQAFKIVR